MHVFTKITCTEYVFTMHLIHHNTLLCNRLEHDSFTAEEQLTFGRMCEVFALDLVTYLNKCLQVIFPPSQIAKALGLTLNKLQETVSTHSKWANRTKFHNFVS